MSDNMDGSLASRVVVLAALLVLPTLPARSAPGSPEDASAPPVATPDVGARSPRADARAAGAPATVDAQESAPAAGTLRTVRRAREMFGVEVQILVTTRSDEEARLAAARLEAAFRELSRVEALLDADREGSDLARLNASAGGAAVLLEPEVFEVLAEAARLARLTSGAFDPTSAALGGLWRFEGDAPRAPPEEAVQAQRALVGFPGLVLDPAARTARLLRPGQRVQLDGLAKGYALDQAARLLEEAGIAGFLIAAGGDLVVRGPRADRPWRVGVQDPRAPGYFATFPATSGAVMTTGDYERFFFQDGERLHHVLDPRTGRPARGLRSVTVVADSGVEADALCTAVFVLGPDAGLALIERLAGVEALLVTADNRVLSSSGLAGALRYRPPTDAP